MIFVRKALGLAVTKMFLTALATLVTTDCVFGSRPWQGCLRVWL
jgi:hypothetical protein